MDDDAPLAVASPAGQGVGEVPPPVDVDRLRRATHPTRRDALEMTEEHCRVRFGALDIRVRTSNRRYIEMLTPLFRVWPSADDDTEPDVELSLIDGRERRSRVDRLGDIMQIERSSDAVRVSTEMSELTLGAGTSPRRATLVIHAAGQDPQLVDHYMVVMMGKLLQLLGRLRLHGAAIVLGGRTHLFLGDKGAGKSTVSLALGRAGGTVLADDQLVLHVEAPMVWVSGVDGQLRLTEATEAHFFAEAIDRAPQDFAGTLKKEVPLADLVAAAPGVEHQPSRVYFSRVGDAFELVPLSPSLAVGRILDSVLPLHRFSGPRDSQELVGMVTTLVRAVDVFDLSLSPDLVELEQLVAFVRE